MNFEKVFTAFRKNYIPVPLETFGSDPYKTLVSALMSSRTNDFISLAAATRLFDKARTLKNLNSLTVSEISKAIYPVGFYRTKAKHLKLLAQRLLKNFKGKVPQTREELMTLPGVGRKTANLVLNRAFGIPAIAVDTHVHRISNLLGWVNTKTPEKTELALIKILPKKYWPETNRLFVSIGRQFTSKEKLVEFLKNKGLINK